MATRQLKSGLPGLLQIAGAGMAPSRASAFAIAKTISRRLRILAFVGLSVKTSSSTVLASWTAFDSTLRERRHTHFCRSNSCNPVAAASLRSTPNRDSALPFGSAAGPVPVIHITSARSMHDLAVQKYVRMALALD